MVTTDAAHELRVALSSHARADDLFKSISWHLFEKPNAKGKSLTFSDKQAASNLLCQAEVQEVVGGQVGGQQLNNYGLNNSSFAPHRFESEFSLSESAALTLLACLRDMSLNVSSDSFSAKQNAA